MPFGNGARAAAAPRLPIKAKGAGKGAKEGRQGKALSERPKAPRAALIRVRHALAVPAQRVPPTAGTPPTSPSETPARVDAAGSTASLLIRRAGKNCWNIWQRTSLSRRQFATLPRPAGRYARAGPAVPGLRPPPRLSGRHAGPRPGDRRLCAEAAAVASAACGRHAGRARAAPGRSLDQARPTRPCCTTSARSRVDLRRACRRRRSGILARPAAPALPLPLPKGASTACTAPPGLGCSTRGSRSGHLRLAQRLSRPVGRAAVRWPRPVRARHARRAGRICAGRPASVAQELGGDPSKALAAPNTPCNANCSTACATCSRKRSKLNQAGPDGWLDPGRLWLVSKPSRQTARASAVARHRQASRPAQYGGVQRAAGSRHRANRRRMAGDLEGYCHQRRRLVARIHLPETRRR